MQTGAAVEGTAAREAVMAEHAPSSAGAAAAAPMHPQGPVPPPGTGDGAPAHVDRLYQASLHRHLCTMLPVRRSSSPPPPVVPLSEGWSDVHRTARGSCSW